MAYTDVTLTGGVKVKAVHVTELSNMVSSFASSAKVSLTNKPNTAAAGGFISAVNVTALRKAINELESEFSGNCCQACQACQSSKCQSCQSSKCQSCQLSTCQSYSCQTTSCQSCQSCQLQCNCNCSEGSANA